MPCTSYPPCLAWRIRRLSSLLMEERRRSPRSMSSALRQAVAMCVLVVLSAVPVARSQLSLATDKIALLAFQAAADSPDKVLQRSWVGDPCINSWIGVTCSKRLRVKELDLSSRNLVGTISPALGNLTGLTDLNLSNNTLTGPIPSTLSNLRSLGFLYLSMNNLTGPVPMEVATLPRLAELVLNDNQLSGEVPALRDLPNLEMLYLARNKLTGSLPPFTNLSGILSIDISGNPLTGSIPAELGALSTLLNLYLSNCTLTGSLPVEVTQIPGLFNLYVAQNNLSGPAPPELGNVKSLRTLDLSQNNFSGPVPPTLGQLGNLTDLFLYENQFEGAIPTEISLLTNLVTIYLQRNNLTGPIPPELGALPNLQLLNLGNNGLTGSIPPQLANIPNLGYLYLSTNYLTGPIPPKLGLPNPVRYDLSNNYLNSTAPPQLANASLSLNCMGLNSSNYYQTGQRDSQVCTQYYPDLQCSCPVPTVIGTNGSCYCVTPLWAQLVFTCNDFRSIGNFSLNLPGVMDQLSGVGALSPAQLAPINFTTSTTPCSVVFTFNVLPLNGTALESGNATAIQDTYKQQTAGVTVPFFNPGYVFIAARELRDTGFTSALMPTKTKSKLSRVVVAVVTVASALILVAITAALVLLIMKWRYRPIRTVIPGTTVKSWKFSQLAKATDGFDEEHVLGSGGFGIVYKGKLDGNAVAVKRLSKGSNQGHGELAKEVEIIGSIHHRNLVCLEGYCIEGDEYLLVYNLMVNGSLEDWLFKKPEKERLTWPICVQIIKGGADALAYLHVGCKEKIIHRDIKPANILLDDNFVAHIADFGLARTTVAANTHVSTRVMGTMGYLAPEYAHTGQLTEKSDVYSFGMMMLVIMSHRDAVDLKMEDKYCSLVDKVINAVQENRLLEDLISPHFVGDYDQAEALRLIHIAILCIQKDWQARPTMDEVRRILHSNMEIPDGDLRSAMSLLRHESPMVQMWVSGGSSILASSIDSSVPTQSVVTSSVGSEA